MLDLTPWVTRLQSQTDLKKVGLAVDLEAARRNLKQMPAAFVIYGREQVARNDDLSDVTQLIYAQVMVIIAVENAGASTGARNLADLKTISDQIDDRLLDWQPADADDPVEYAGGNLLGFGDQILWWGNNYATQYIKQR